jgi:hypothetical protein
MVMERCGHYMRNNKAREKPGFILFFDVESNLLALSDKTTEHTPRLICCSYQQTRKAPRKNTRKDFTLHSMAEFWDLVDTLAKPMHPMYCTAHNLNYDLGVLHWDTELTERGWELGWIHTKGSTTIIRMQHGKRELIFVDNMNWFHESLAKVGERMGLPKLDTDPLNATDEELLPYCQRDVEIMVRAWAEWFKFLDDHDLGNWGTTVPSQAMRAFKHRFLHDKLLVHHHPEALELERAAYRGGRTSVFYRGHITGRTVHYLDIKSAYPAAMLTHDVPIRLLFVSHLIRLDELAEWLKDKCVIAEVDLYTDSNPFPVHYHGHNVYPVGEFTTTLTTPELIYAQEHGWIKHIVRAAVYVKAPIFHDYVTEFYQLRQDFDSQGDKIQANNMKLMLNGLYGKFGQTASDFVKMGQADEVIDGPTTWYDHDTCKSKNIYRFGTTLYTEEEQGETKESMPSIAAHVTAYVRLRLFALREKAGLQEVLYCDTDSLFVTDTGAHRLSDEPDDTQLGGLGEKDTTTDLVIMSPKTYCMDGAWTRKGIPDKASEIFPHTFQYTSFPSLRGQARRSSITPYYTDLVTRKLYYTIYDGKVGPDGWIIPLQGSDLTMKLHEDPLVDQRVWEIDMTIESLQETRLVPVAVMLKLWNYNHGTFKQGRTSRGKLVPIEYSNMDTQATELGFTDLEHLQQACQDQLSIDAEIRQLRSERKRLLTVPTRPLPTPTPTVTPEPV